MDQLKSSVLERQWLDRRRGGVGSSESPVLYLGDVYGQTPLDVYLGKVNPPGKRQADNPNFRRGHTYEPLALALFERQTGIRIYAPETDEDRYVRYQCGDPDRPWLFSDFDGLCADGWVAEVKAPRAFVASRISAEGVPDHNLVQCHHHNHVARAAAALPGLGDAWRGRVRGTRLIIYDCETVDLQVYEVPYDPAFSGEVVERARCFWEDHVVPRRPPAGPAPRPRRAIPQRGGAYELVSGPSWEDAARDLFFADQLRKGAQRRYDQARATIMDAMRALDKPRVMLRDRVKFLLLQQTRKSLNRGRLLADYPGLDLDRYMEDGEPFEAFRAYGGAELVDGAETVEGGIGSLHDALGAYAALALDPEDAVEEYDRLRGQAELYGRLLQGELAALEQGMRAAMSACEDKIRGGSDGKEQ